MKRSPEKPGFGDFLLLMADRLDQAEANPAAVLDCLDQINEAWSRQLDPVREFEAYAALRLCQSMRKALEKRGQSPFSSK